MTIKTFIKINATVSADQAALVAAGINPAEVNNSVSAAKQGNYWGWDMALTVREALLNNLCDNNIFDPEPVLIKYRDNYGNDVTQISDLVDIIPALLEMGVPDSARFKAPSLWQWIAKNVSIDPEICDWINECYPTNNTKPSPSESPLTDAQPGENIASLVDQIVELTARLKEAEAEIATLKAGIPHFRHMTPALRLVAEVQERYWGDTREPNKIPKQFTILHELENIHGLSNAKAKNVEYVASPIDRVTGKNLCSS